MSHPLKRWLASRLHAWFARCRRELPWRQDRDPYRIWVSEVMLQQTQVATVIPYFERFLQAFPTLSALAQAAEQDVLRLWEGLGYYRRACDLHRTAGHIQALFDGTFPARPEQLTGLPGLGRYTVNAVLSQAFDASLPILEVNSQRVLCRLFGRGEDPTRNPLRRWLWQTAEELVPQQRAGEFNQAIMELGALVCTPASPRCPECPLRSKCATRRLGLQDTIPFRPVPRSPTEVREVAAVLRDGARVLLVQRSATGRWANLWEFPHGELRDTESHDQAALRLLKEFTGIDGRLGAELQTIRYAVTRFRITMVCFECWRQQGRLRLGSYTDSHWVKPAQLANYPVSSPQRRLIRSLSETGRQQELF